MAHTGRLKGASGTQELWSAVASGGVAMAAASLAKLAEARQTPSQQQVALLLHYVQRPGAPAAFLLPAMALLARWARQQALRPAAGREMQLLQRASAAAQALLRGTEPPLSSDQPLVVTSCLLLLSGVAAAGAGAGVEDEAVEAVGSALLAGRLGRPVPASAADAMAAVGTLLPCLLAKPVAACWLLAALLRWLGSWSPPAGEPPCLALDCLAPAYAMSRGAAVAAIRSSPGPAAAQELLQPLCAVLRDAAATASLAAVESSEQLVQAAAAVLALGGLVEGLLRAAAGSPEAVQLAAEAEGSLAAACTAAGAASDVDVAAAVTAPMAAAAATDWSGSDQALLLGACALASAQLCGAVQRRQLAAASARCQAQALLHGAFSLAPLHHAATTAVLPAQTSTLLRRQLGCAMVQQAAGMASSLAALYPQLPGGEQRWLVQQVQVAARRAHELYRQLALSASPAWLAAVDATCVRQLLDKLFLAGFALLAAAWQAAAAPEPAWVGTPPAARSAAAPAPGDGQLHAAARAQLAAGVVGVLADLQFCRVATAQYAALLRAALAEAPCDPAAAASLAACLPRYADLEVRCPARGGQATWLVDAVTVAKVQLLFNALVPCCGMLTVTTLEERVAPPVFLYLLHPHRPAAAAAHQLFCALLVTLPEERRDPLAAFYVRRSLEGCTAGTPPLPEVGQGLATVLASLPLGSPVPLLCLRQLLEACEALVARNHPNAEVLAALVAQSLLLVEHAQLDGALAACAQMTVDGWAPAAALLRTQLQTALQHSDDCVRKPALAAWLLRGEG